MTINARIVVSVSNHRLRHAAAFLIGFLVSVGSLASEGDSDVGNALSTGSLQIASEETQPDDSRGKMGKKKASKGEQSETNEKFLSAEELANLFPDTEISHINPNSGSSVLMFFRADGTLTGTSRSSRNGQVNPILGDWFVTPRGTLCFSSEQQGRLCFYLVRRGDRQLIRYGRTQKLMPGIDWTIVKPGPRAHLVLGTL